MYKKIAFFDAKPYDQLFFDRFNTDYGFDVTFFQTRLSAKTVELARGFDGVCVFVNDVVDRAVLEKLHEYDVNVIALRCAGYNNVDFKYAYGKVHVLRVPAYSPYAVAEHTVALMMSLNRKIHKAYYRTRDGNFSINGFLGFDMHGKTAGIVGTGKIGRCVISILKGFGMNVLAYDAYPDEGYASEAGVRYVELDELYSKSDIISMHCPLTPETHYLINRNTIAKCTKGFMLINTGRGKLVDTRALIEGLISGQVGSAGLDVYEEESNYFFEDFSTELISDEVLARLMTFPNVLLTSHQGFFTAEALENIAITTLDNLKEYFEGGFLKNEICYKCDAPCRKEKKERCF